MYPHIDPEVLRWSGPIPSRSRRPSSPPSRRDRRFLKGPIPLAWLASAGRLPGKALHVAIALWFVVGVAKTREVKLSSALLAELGVDRHAGYRGLAALERAHLVQVVRHRGRQPLVTVLEVPTP